MQVVSHGQQISNHRSLELPCELQIELLTPAPDRGFDLVVCVVVEDFHSLQMLKTRLPIKTHDLLMKKFKSPLSID